MGEDVRDPPPEDEELEENFGECWLELLPLFDIEPLLSLGDKLEFRLDDLEELGLELDPFLLRKPPPCDIPQEEEDFIDFDLAGTGLNVAG